MKTAYRCPLKIPGPSECQIGTYTREDSIYARNECKHVIDFFGNAYKCSIVNRNGQQVISATIRTLQSDDLVINIPLPVGRTI